MWAQRLHRQGPITEAPLRWEHVPLPAPGPGQVRVRVLACGVCHTDLHLVQGDLPLRRAPVVPGHQIVGTIDAVGEGVAGERLGRLVGVPWLARTCGRCEFCRTGRENLCAEARFTGWDVDGGYAEYAVVADGAAHALPAGVDPLRAAPWLCAGVIGYRSLRVADVRPGQRLGLFGFGASAHLALQVARAWECEVYVFTRSAEHRRLAEQLGARWTGSATDEPPAKLHAAVTFAPVGWIVREALGKLARGGTVAINAIHLDEIPPLDYTKHLYWERGVRSVTNLTAADVRQFLDLAARHDIRSHVRAFPLARANEALRALADSALEAAAVLVPEAEDTGGAAAQTTQEGT